MLMQDLGPLQCRSIYLLLHILFYFLRHGRYAEEEDEKTSSSSAAAAATTTTTTKLKYTRKKLYFLNVTVGQCFSKDVP